MTRLFDIIISILLLLLLLPVFAIVIPILRLTGEGEIFYRQRRVGYRERDFDILKFATMLKDSPNIGAGTITERDDPRVLPFGKILRRTKINELPQLINICVGDMSLIGPRPHARRDLRGVDPDVLRMCLSVKPGLSGVASIVFRNEEDIIHDQLNGRKFYDDVIAPYKAELELWYVEHRCLLIYVALIILTALVVSGTSKARIVYRVFGSLPYPPTELAPYIFS